MQEKKRDSYWWKLLENTYQVIVLLYNFHCLQQPPSDISNLKYNFTTKLQDWNYRHEKYFLLTVTKFFWFVSKSWGVQSNTVAPLYFDIYWRQAKQEAAELLVSYNLNCQGPGQSQILSVNKETWSIGSWLSSNFMSSNL